MTQMRVGGEDLWWIDYMMHVGEGESEGLRFSGLRERILHVLGEHQDVMSHPALNEHKTQESTREELDEERQAIKALQGHHYHEEMPLPLDTTMAVVRRIEDGEKKLSLISPVPITAATVAELEVKDFESCRRS